jgi:outer membrane protein assembly factor BamB
MIIFAEAISNFNPLQLNKSFGFLNIITIASFAIVLLNSCSTFESDSWKISIPEIGMTSSPRPVDLNNDGVLDLVIGGGSGEFRETDYGVIAIDGSNGEIMWKVGAWNQVVGSPMFMDITEDGTPDVFIGGRSAFLAAIDGSNGDVIWQYLSYNSEMDLINDTSFLNFYNPQFVGDVDMDGYKDLLVSFGGYFKAGTGDPERPSGQLMLIGSRSGKVLRKLDMPDGKETYMSPIIYDFLNNGKPDIIIGTGGESLNGELFRIKFEDLLAEKLSDTLSLASGDGKGFIAPPVLTDINGDGILDIIVNAVNGRMISIDGKTNETIWEVSLGDGFEVYTMPAPGNFTGDSTPDFYGSFGKGVWPDSEFIAHIIVDGKDGKVVFSDSIGFFQYASPVIYDLTKNGIDEVLIVNNNVRKASEGMELMLYSNDLRVLEIEKADFGILIGPFNGSNLGSTPLITDLDNDGYIDIIYSFMEDAGNFYSFKESRIERMELQVVKKDSIIWGSYMGSNYDGIYLTED